MNSKLFATAIVAVLALSAFGACAASSASDAADEIHYKKDLSGYGDDSAFAKDQTIEFEYQHAYPVNYKFQLDSDPAEGKMTGLLTKHDSGIEFRNLDTMEEVLGFNIRDGTAPHGVTFDKDGTNLVIKGVHHITDGNITHTFAMTLTFELEVEDLSDPDNDFVSTQGRYSCDTFEIIPDEEPFELKSQVGTALSDNPCSFEYETTLKAERQLDATYEDLVSNILMPASFPLTIDKLKEECPGVVITATGNTKNIAGADCTEYSVKKDNTDATMYELNGYIIKFDGDWYGFYTTFSVMMYVPDNSTDNGTDYSIAIAAGAAIAAVILVGAVVIFRPR